MAASSSLYTILSLILLVLPPPTAPATFPADLAALRDVKAAIDPTSIPSSSCLSSWDFTFDPCDSAFTTLFTCGLRCDATTAGLLRVTELALDSAGYTGTLSRSVWSLPYLDTLHLADNRLSGPIPPPSSAGLPARLSRATLSRNAFSGPIPTFTPAPALEELYLDGNLLVGSIPASLSALGRLRRLELQENNLTGEIPPQLPPSLTHFDASNNSLSGGFPAGLPATLVTVTLRGNQLEGELPPPAVSGLPALMVLDLRDNTLTGEVPAAVFEHPSLEQLSLGGNMLESVALPADGGAGSKLIEIELSHNRVAGMLPRFLGAMPALSAVDLEDNRFTGMIPAEYAVRAASERAAVVVPFARLMLAGNYLFGPIPSAMGLMKEGTAAVSLADNCLLRCPAAYFFCGGGEQKTPATCRGVSPVIP